MNNASSGNNRNGQSVGNKPVQDGEWVLAMLFLAVPSFFLRLSPGPVGSAVWTALGAVGLIFLTYLLVRVRRLGTASKTWLLIVVVAALILIVSAFAAWR
jgi:hypothetical protein